MGRLLCLCSLIWLAYCAVDVLSVDYEGQVVKGNRNALYLVKDGKKRLFPDFYTFSHMGFNAGMVKKIPDDDLSAIPLGSPVDAIPVFRPEDYMYHTQCEDHERMVSPLLSA